DGQQVTERLVAGTGFRVLRGLIEFFWAFMIFATGIVVIRTLLVAFLAWRHFGAQDRARRHNEQIGPAPVPAISVVIAAFNEGKVIAKTIRSVLETNFVGELELIVVDDGSRDNTADEVERLAAADARIVLVRQPNRGKALALRNGVFHARHGVLVFL